MKNLKRTVAFISALTLIGTMASCSNDDSPIVSESTTVSTAPK